MNKVLLACLLACLTCFSYAQSAYWLMLTDKGREAEEGLTQAKDQLSPAALQLRAKKGIALSYSDLPVSPTYLEELKGQGLTILSTSRWLNAVAVRAGNCELENLEAFSFIKEIRPCATFVAQGYEEASLEDIKDEWAGVASLEYGKAFRQAEMLNLPPFHEAGFTGKGVRIAVLDAGFPGVDTVDAFKKLNAEGRLLATYDFVEKDTMVFHASSHGTQVLSCIGSDLPGQIVGTAPDASFILCRTEDARSETQVEEYNFLAAVEYADSIGVDLIHASLGYTIFDNDSNSYTYEDLDGDKAIVTKAVDMAASKGILVTVSAGNEGNASWHYIAAPCDGDSILCVGSVTKYMNKSGFSSFGPTADGRIKPDVMALGSSATVFSPRNRVGYASGTSFAGPIMAGFMACLKQAHPERNNMDLIQATRLSGDQAGLPDNEYGYGIPNVMKADSLLKARKNLNRVKIVQKEKPMRGRRAFAEVKKEVKKTEVFTKDPKTVISKTPRKLKAKVPSGVKIQEVEIKSADKVLELGKTLKVKNKKAVLKTKEMNAGKYILIIKTDTYTERIPFRL